MLYVYMAVVIVYFGVMEILCVIALISVAKNAVRWLIHRKRENEEYRKMWAS